MDDGGATVAMPFSRGEASEWLDFESLELEREFGGGMQANEEEDDDDDMEDDERYRGLTSAAVAASGVGGRSCGWQSQQDFVPQPKAARDLVKPEAKEVQESGAKESDDESAHHRDDAGGHGEAHCISAFPAEGDKRRLERNAREQKRSLKISQKIEELRKILRGSGVPAKSSKSSILHEATIYIRQLQRRQAQVEQEREQFLQLLQQETGRGGGSGAPATAPACGGFPPSISGASAVGGSSGVCPPGTAAPPMGAPGMPTGAAAAGAEAAFGSGAVGAATTAVNASSGPALVAAAMAGTTVVTSHDYQLVFHCAAVPMAIASVNGNIVDCNLRLTAVTGYPKDELLTLTIFNLVADQFLQQTFG
ncbi:unnamed protein product [Phaeothamnion confervicola]